MTPAAIGHMIDGMAEIEHPRYGVLRAIAAFDDANRFAPSLRELARDLGTSMSTVHHHVESLRDEGLVTWVPTTARTLRLTNEGRARVNGKRK